MTNINIIERPSYQQRVLKEVEELKVRLDYLILFLDAPFLKTLDPQDQTLLHRQAAAMLTLLTILEARVARF